MTGCRTSEAIGLQWKHIRRDCTGITFNETLVRKGTGTARLRKATKTNRARFFPCNGDLQNLLLAVRPEDYKPDMLVFPSPKGKPIDATQLLKPGLAEHFEEVRHDSRKRAVSHPVQHPAYVY